MELVGVLLFFAAIAAVIALCALFDKKILYPAALKRRERQIETAMRFGMIDAELEEQIARRLLDERIKRLSGEQ